ncbi:MAG: epoxyqueuosine reductase QueH [Lachnospiraceae bacterium]|nr:epoxyqueuosine reductase QueH [Lachnospiraceae bacterium]
MNTVNYHNELLKIIDKVEETAEREHKPAKLLLHSCCAPCSSYCLELLCSHFETTVFYYNPNITDAYEYLLRMEEQKRLIACFNAERRGYHIHIKEGDYNPLTFLKMCNGYEKCPEGGDRCFKCYRLRLEKTAATAKKEGFDYFGTTLTISPLKNAAKINEIGSELAAEYKVNWLYSDFKKNEGFKRSIELSKEYNLYRQNFCGCIYSQNKESKNDNGGTE